LLERKDLSSKNLSTQKVSYYFLIEKENEAIGGTGDSRERRARWG
jgi:hypothetical protein